MRADPHQQNRRALMSTAGAELLRSLTDYGLSDLEAITVLSSMQLSIVSRMTTNEHKAANRQ